MEPNLTAHYMAIETDRARLSQQAERGWIAEQAAARQPKRTGPLAVHRRVGAVLAAVVSHRVFTVRQRFTHLHSARHSARG